MRETSNKLFNISIKLLTMKNIYNIVPNNHENHIIISYRIHKSKNHHQTSTQGINLVISGPQWTDNDVLSRYRHALELHG